jgi:hypothetical protein
MGAGPASPQARAPEKVITPTHVAFARDGPKSRRYKAAMEPGLRFPSARRPRTLPPDYYGAFVLDPDGHIEAVFTVLVSRA